MDKAKSNYMNRWKVNETLETIEPQEKKKFLESLLKDAKALKRKFKKREVEGALLMNVPVAIGTASLCAALLGSGVLGIILGAAGIASLIVNNKLIFDNVLPDKEYYTDYAPMIAKEYQEDINYLKKEIKKLETDKNTSGKDKNNTNR